MSRSKLRSSNIHEIACSEWFDNSDILAILTNPYAFNQVIHRDRSSLPPPTNGTLLLFDKSFKQFKEDGVEWSRKPDRRHLQETFTKLNVEGVERIQAVYATAEVNRGFQRRYYRLLTAVGDAPDCILVHYRQCAEKKKQTRPPRKSAASSSQLSQQQPDSDADTNDNNSGAGNSGFGENELSEFMADGSLFLDDDSIPFEVDLTSNDQSPQIPAVFPGFVQQPQSFPQHQYMQQIPVTQPPSCLPPFMFQQQHHHQHLSQQQQQYSQQFSNAPFYCSILDFSPECASVEGGSKLLLVLSDPLPPHVACRSIQIIFGTIFSPPVELVSSTVLRCRVPAAVPIMQGTLCGEGPVPLSVAVGGDVIISYPCSQRFVYMLPPSMISMSMGSMGQSTLYQHQQQQQQPIQQLQLPSNSGTPYASLTSRSDSNSNSSNNSSSHNSMAHHSRTNSHCSSTGDNHAGALLAAAASGKMRGSRPRSPDQVIVNGESMTMGEERSQQQQQDQENDNNNKIRVVTHNTAHARERFTARRSRDGSTGNGTDDSDNEEDDEDTHTLNMLSSMTPTRMQHMMDDYLVTVVKQLVQMAQSDVELQSEIHELDANGFSLLHYVCMYGLTSSVPLLLSRKSVDINQQTPAPACATPLHLAARAGHVSVVECLLLHEADAYVCDGDGLTAFEVAKRAGKEDVCVCIQQHLEYRETCKRALSSVGMVVPQPPAGLPLSTSSSLSSSSSSSSTSSSSSSANASTQMFSSLMQQVLQLEQQPSGNDPTAALSNRLLQEAFASLSLTDKCAFARTISSMTQQQQQQLSSEIFEQSSNEESVQFFQQSHQQTAATAPMATTFLQHQTPPMGHPQSPPHTHHQHNSTNTVHSSSPAVAMAASNDPINGMNMGSLLDDGLSNTSTTNEELDSSFDMRSVLSDADHESLGVVMSMMGESELLQVENEVRIIQNNVRGWLLRKNFLNLRSAARKIMSAWRERKKVTTSTNGQSKQQRSHMSPRASGNTHTLAHTLTHQTHGHRGSLLKSEPLQSIKEEEGNHMDVESDSLMIMSLLTRSASSDGDGGGLSNANSNNNSSSSSGNMYSQLPLQSPDLLLLSSPGSVDGNAHDVNLIQDVHAQVDEAAAKLQAVTRGVIARRSFAALKRQAVASLVIQKSLMQWWGQGGHGTGGQGAGGAGAGAGMK